MSLERALAAVAVFSVAALLFAWGAWRASARWGPRALVAAWAVGAIVATALMAAPIHRAQATLGFSTAQQARFPIFGWFLPMWATALAAVALVVRRRAQAEQAHFTAGFAARGLAAFWAGSSRTSWRSHCST